MLLGPRQPFFFRARGSRASFVATAVVGLAGGFRKLSRRVGEGVVLRYGCQARFFMPF